MPTVSGFTAEHLIDLLDETIVSARVVGRNLIFTTKGGFEIDAGDVGGFADTTPTAAEISVTPAGTISSTNAQAAVAELGADIIDLQTTKVNATARPKIWSGTLTFRDEVGAGSAPNAFTEAYAPGNGFTWGEGFFTQIPNVIVTPTVTTTPDYFQPSIVVIGINLRTFSITAKRPDRDSVVLNYVVMGV